MAEICLPAKIAGLAERQTWFDSNGAMEVLNWLSAKHVQLSGIETARKCSDGEWMLLLDPLLDLSSVEDPDLSIKEGRAFVTENADKGLMFEMVW
jgi:hypothetical protein